MIFRTNTAICSALITFLMFAAMPAQANYQWLKDSPASKFNQQDWDMLKATARAVLDEGEDGEMRSWDNIETGNSGKIKIIESSADKRCRKVAFLQVAGDYGLTGRQIHRLCKQEDGSWKIEK